MSVFNSLGSNYTWRYALRSLLSTGSKQSFGKLEQLLEAEYGGKALLTYKGREALEQALKWSGLPAGSAIGINGFTCYVVYRAVERAGYRPVFIDVAPHALNFGLTELKHAHKANTDLKAIIVQNTLGFPADMSKLVDFAHEHELLVIEDLAHSFGAVYEDGHQAGTVGDLTMLSFSQDKPLDVVAGGAVIDRRKRKPKTVQFLPVSVWKLELNRDYPFWTGIIRGTYPIGIGRIIHLVLKKLRLLATPMSDAGPGIHRMSVAAAAQITSKWPRRDKELIHRQEIAKIYQANLPAELLFSDKLGQASYLRFPLWTDDRASLIKHLAKHHIYVGDTWYDAPIAPSRYVSQTSYQAGMCPNGDELSVHIVNLPTHRHVTPALAANICDKIKQWQAL